MCSYAFRSYAILAYAHAEYVWENFDSEWTCRACITRVASGGKCVVESKVLGKWQTVIMTDHAALCYVLSPDARFCVHLCFSMCVTLVYGCVRLICNSWQAVGGVWWVEKRLGTVTVRCTKHGLLRKTRSVLSLDAHGSLSRSFERLMLSFYINWVTTGHH